MQLLMDEVFGRDKVETGKSDAMANIRKDLQVEYDQILVVRLEDGVREKIRSQLEEVDLSGKDRVFVLDLSEALGTNLT